MDGAVNRVSASNYKHYIEQMQHINLQTTNQFSSVTYYQLPKMATTKIPELPEVNFEGAVQLSSICLNVQTF